jgi:hypothetical protein
VSSGFSFVLLLRPRQPGEGSSLLISYLKSSIKYKGGAKTRRHLALRGMSLTRGVHYDENKANRKGAYLLRHPLVNNID